VPTFSGPGHFLIATGDRMSLPSFNPEKTAKSRLWLLGWYMYKNFTKNLEEKKTTKATFKPINCKSSSYLSADCSLPNKLVV